MKNNDHYNLLFVNKETGIYRRVFLQNTRLKADYIWKEAISLQSTAPLLTKGGEVSTLIIQDYQGAIFFLFFLSQGKIGLWFLSLLLLLNNRQKHGQGGNEIGEF